MQSYKQPWGANWILVSLSSPWPIAFKPSWMRTRLYVISYRWRNSFADETLLIDAAWRGKNRKFGHPYLLTQTHATGRDVNRSNTTAQGPSFARTTAISRQWSMKAAIKRPCMQWPTDSHERMLSRYTLLVTRDVAIHRTTPRNPTEREDLKLRRSTLRRLVVLVKMLTAQAQYVEVALTPAWRGYLFLDYPFLLRLLSTGI